MDFLYSIHHIKNIWSFNRYIFSIGTYQYESFQQLMFPLTKCENTILFAIDQKYRSLDLSVMHLEIDKLTYKNVSELTKIPSFYNEQFNILIVFICDNIKSSYNETGITHLDFLYTLDCKPYTKDWLLFERFLLELIEKNKKIYINNWVIFNTRYFEQNDTKRPLYRYRNTGQFFEYFPELGYILHSVYTLYPNSKLFVTLQEKVLPITHIFKK